MTLLQKGEAASEWLLAELDREIRDRGRGSIRALERALGKRAGWWQHRVEAGSMTMPQLLAVLDYLGFDAARFLSRARVKSAGLALGRPRGEPPAVVTRALARYRTRKPGSGLGREYLDTLDEERFHRPEEAVRQATWALERVEPEMVPLCLGVLGSGWRLLMALDEAEHAICAGIGLAEGNRDQPTLADLLQRLGYVVADRGDYGEALRLAEKAAFLYAGAKKPVGIGKAFVDHGIWLYYLDCPEEAIAAQKTALHYLPKELWRSRVGALQLLGLSHQKLGALDEALGYLARAIELAPRNGGESGRCLWLQAKIHIDLEQFAEAETCMAKVVEICRSLHYGSTALATVDLVRAQLLQGRATEAWETVNGMHELIWPLNDFPAVSAAIASLIRSKPSALTLQLVEEARERIEQARERHDWHSLRVPAVLDE